MAGPHHGPKNLRHKQMVYLPRIQSASNAANPPQYQDSRNRRHAPPKLPRYDPKAEYMEMFIQRRKALNEEAKRATHPLSNKKNIDILQRFPKDIVDLILKHVLTHSRPIPVNAVFRRANPNLPPALDYRILHTCRELYSTGIRYYYGQNTFSIALELWALSPDSFSPARWPHQYGLTLASELVRSVKIHVRGCTWWHKSLDLLCRFKQLDKIVFDARNDPGIDNSNDDGMLFDTWAEVPASQDLCDILVQAGIKIGRDGVWVGHRGTAEALGCMKNLVVPQLQDRLTSGPPPAKAKKIPWK